MDENLTFNTHINTIIKNVNHKMYLLKRVKGYLTPKTCILIYKSFILPLMEYGCTLYMNANNSHLNRLQILQNKCLKICLDKDKKYNTELLHKEANINLLSERRDVQLMKEMFLRTKLDKYLDKNVSGRVTRSHTVPKLYVPSFKTNQARKSHIYKGSVAWNNLEYTEKKIMCKDMFSKLMKKKLKEKRKLYNES